MTEKAPTLRERLDWQSGQGEIRDGEIRYLMVRADALMGLFRRLSPETRTAALAAFRDSILEHGGRSAQVYRQRGAAEADALLAVVAETAPQLGWGVWELERRENGLDLSVRNSPFVAGYGNAEEPVCAPVVGMLEAVTGLVTGARAQGHERHCAAVHGGDVCRFRAEVKG